jgi:hypothetical protein
MHVFEPEGARLATVTASTDARDLSGAFVQRLDRPDRAEGGKIA